MNRLSYSYVPERISHSQPHESGSLLRIVPRSFNLQILEAKNQALTGMAQLGMGRKLLHKHDDDEDDQQKAERKAAKKEKKLKEKKLKEAERNDDDDDKVCRDSSEALLQVCLLGKLCIPGWLTGWGDGKVEILISKHSRMLATAGSTAGLLPHVLPMGKDSLG